MSWFSKLFGGGDSAPPEAEAETYKDFSIFPEPLKEGGSYRVAARIEKEIGGETRSHYLIRADTLQSAEAAAEAAVAKAKLLIDEQGESIF